jgi:hypothetical protein
MALRRIGQGRRDFFSAAIIAGSVAHQPFISKLFLSWLPSQMQRFPEPEFTEL